MKIKHIEQLKKSCNHLACLVETPFLGLAIFCGLLSASTAWAADSNQVAAVSGAAWPPVVKPPAGAPNIVLIVLDDVGYSWSSVFGGPVPTPNIDRLASE